MSEAPELTSWCLGVPFEGTRRLAPEELAELHERTRALGRRTLWRCLWIPVLPAVAAAFCVVVFRAVSYMPPLLLAVSMFVALLGVPASLAVPFLLVKDADDLRQISARDERAGEVLRFAGSRPFFNLGDPAPRRLAECGALDPAAENVVVEVLPFTRTVWTVNGRRPSIIVPVVVHDAPDAVAEIVAASRSTRAIPVAGSPHPLHTARRPFTEAERNELEALLRAMRSPEPIVALAVTVVFGGAWLVTRPFEPVSWAIGISATGFAAVLVRNVVVTRRLAKRVAQDLAGGVAELSRFPVMAQDGPMLSPPVERLPLSRILWTLDGRPVAWRHVSVRGRSV